MRFTFVPAALAVIMLIAGVSPAQPKRKDAHIADTPPLAPAEQVKKFHVPPGFAIQLVAADPDVKKPINIAFDAKGRLWVTGSEEYPFPAPADRKAKDTVKILEDFGPDGKARKVTTFADGLNIPIGVLPLPDCKSALVFSIPNIWKLTDTDGDGKADQKEAMYTGFGSKDTHGMTGEFMWGFDGWIYCCHGFANESHVKAAKGDTPPAPPLAKGGTSGSPPLAKGGTGGSIKMQSGNTYRIKPDGSRIEQYTWGQVNPFGLAIDPLGNFYSTDCHSRPIYQLLKGAYYPSFGKPHDGLGFAPEMVKHDHGSTGLAGIAYYAADHYPKEFHDNLFIGNVITNRINRDRIEWHGSTPKGIEMPDFVKCDDPWFRPVDIKLGPDGALYVADFYNRIIGHYEVPLDHPLRDREKGRIWRIVYVGEDGKGKPKEYRPMPARTVEETIDALADPNLSVRTFAANELVARGPDTLESLRNVMAADPAVRQAHGVWILQRLNLLSHADLASFAQSADRTVRLHALKVVAERLSALGSQETRTELDLARAMTRDSDRFVLRAAAEALGARPDHANIVALTQILERIQRDDASLHHTIRMALRNQLLDKSVMKLALKGTFPTKDATVDALLDVCLGVPNADAARFLLQFGRLTTDRPTLHRRYYHVGRYGDKPTRHKFIETIPGTGLSVKAFVQGTQERGAKLDDEELAWAESQVMIRLQARKPEGLQTAIELAGVLKIDRAQDELLGIIENSEKSENERKAAITAIVAIEPRLHISRLADMLLAHDQSIGLREQIATSFAGANVPEAHTALIQAFEKAPATLQMTIAVGMTGSPQGGDKLLDAVAAGKASPRLLQDRNIEARLKFARVPNVNERLAKLTKGLPPADQRIQDLIGKRKSAFVTVKTDAQEGRLLFEKHCAACHIVANKGAKIGPQLDGIGIRGLERLLEDILDPSRNVDQAFRATTLELDNGQFVTGLLLREEGKVLVMADNLGKEVRVEGGKVVSRSVGQLSPMPANLIEQIPERDFHHLMAFLLEQRAK